LSTGGAIVWGLEYRIVAGASVQFMYLGESYVDVYHLRLSFDGYGYEFFHQQQYESTVSTSALE
jgi:hypothetical protein